MAKKIKAVKLPKKVAGVKVSKRTRKNVGLAFGLLGTPQGLALMGSAVAALAGAVAGRIEERGKRRKGGK